jgi:glycosyltransferase involved in cell wall biosynthesis
MNKLTLIYTTNDIHSGQKVASEIIEHGFLQKDWTVNLIKIPGIDRLSEKNRFRKILSLILPLLIKWYEIIVLLVFNKEEQIVHLNIGQSKISLFREAMPFLIAGRFIHNKRVIISLHGSFFMKWEYSCIEAWVFRRLSRIVDIFTILGPSQKKKLIEMGLHSEKIFVVDNTCLISSMNIDEISVKQKYNIDSINILFLSSLMEKKGYRNFIEAISKVATFNNQPIRVSICGKISPESDSSGKFTSNPNMTRQWLIDKLNQMNCKSNLIINWIDGVDGLEKQHLFHAAHIFVLPSLTEGQPISLIEAMASGCAIVTSNVGEIESTLDDKTAKIIPIEDLNIDSIAYQINSLMVNLEDRTNLAINAYQLFQERFSLDRHILKWEELFLKKSNH